ncbi:MAG: hypothetical protein MZU97_00650 [Bacillus subtilis]|nr:hypothetical protein [Bacillus subtilis]
MIRIETSRCRPVEHRGVRSTTTASVFPKPNAKRSSNVITSATKAIRAWG